jgi:glycine dehydrogenase subunit 2
MKEAENIHVKPADTPLIYELSRPGRRSFQLPKLDVPEAPLTNLIPEKFLRKTAPALPEVDELQIVRHFTNLSKKNFGVDDAFYPLGSCTMKYNPKINERVAAMPGFARLHPYQPEETVQGILEVLYELQQYLKEIAGMPAVSLMPAAGAHGELTSLMVIKAYHTANKREPKLVLIPDLAHGTNPASCTVCGYDVYTIRSTPEGNLDLEDLTSHLNENVAAIMITNPNTLGLFEEEICHISELAHNVGALVYMDGANMNALVGVARPGSFGIDVMHFNTHKTFSTPHGGGGPGAGPIAVTEALSEFLPGHVVAKDAKKGSYYLTRMAKSIGRTRGFFGSSNILLRAYTYMRSMGHDGLAQVGPMAVLNANYLMRILQKCYALPHDRHCMHEFVLSATPQKRDFNVRALDIAKRLLEMHIHAPTIYFPLTVAEAIMIEPTETENKETLDHFIRVMQQIAQEAKDDPESLHKAPRNLPVKRLNEVQAARNPVLRWRN